MRNLVLIKLGGGVITNKSKRYGLRRSVLSRLVNEIAEGMERLDDTYLVIGNGAGSFAHFSAHKYRTADGFVGDESRVGLGWVRYDAIKLNQLVFEQLLSSNIPVFSFSPSSFFRVNNGKVTRVFADPIKDVLAKGMVPLVYGDAMVDASCGSAIFSTERVFEELVRIFVNEYKIKILHINSEEGVLVDGTVVVEITRETFAKVKDSLSGSSGVDVTGGMKQKVESSLTLADKGVMSMIVSGLVPGRVRDAILGKKVIGTTIC